MDDVKVYSGTMTEKKIQAENKDYYESVLQAKVDEVKADRSAWS
ncbi:MAG: hypothetical protein V8S08_10230 [Lachnoclostridium sp.]